MLLVALKVQNVLPRKSVVIMTVCTINRNKRRQKGVRKGLDEGKSKHYERQRSLQLDVVMVVDKLDNHMTKEIVQCLQISMHIYLMLYNCIQLIRSNAYKSIFNSLMLFLSVELLTSMKMQLRVQIQMMKLKAMLLKMLREASIVFYLSSCL